MQNKEEQKQHLIDMMRGDEELGLYNQPKKLFTDHPITEFGDEEFKEAPIRECELLSFDNNKYCYVKIEGIKKEIKRCYIYPQKGRCGDVDCVSIEEIKELLNEEPKQETLEEAINNFKKTDVYINEIKQKQERMYSDEELGLYESWVKDAEKESNLSDLNDRANAFWSGYRAGIKSKERMYSEVIDLFITEIKSEFKDDNWDYLEFIKERVVKRFKNK